jgi:hypothetical protein
LIRSVEFELRTISEANAREHWQARKERRGGQRDTVRAILQRELGHAPRLHVLNEKLFTVPNLITVTLTRLAPGALDDDNLSSAFKAVRDEIAVWIGVDDRDARIRWQYAQERTAQGVYRVRVEVLDATPGEPIRKVLAGEAEHHAGALQRVRPKKAAAQALLPAKASFAALPWEQPPCDACDGRGAGGVGAPCAKCGATVWALCRRVAGFGNDTTETMQSVHDARLGLPCGPCKGTGLRRRLAPLARFSRTDDPPARIEMPVPAEHQARYGLRLTLCRRPAAFKATGEIWLYEHQPRTTT